MASFFTTPLSGRHLQVYVNGSKVQDYWPDEAFWSPSILVLAEGSTVEIRDYDDPSNVPIYVMPYEIQVADPEELINFCIHLLRWPRQVKIPDKVPF